jgi:hypothetical protein
MPVTSTQAAQEIARELPAALYDGATVYCALKIVFLDKAKLLRNSIY